MSNDDRQGRWPTPEEFVSEWDQRTPEARLAMAERIINDSQMASRCFVMNHDSLFRQAASMGGAVARVEALADEWDADGEDDNFSLADVARELRSRLAPQHIRPAATIADCPACRAALDGDA